MSHHHHAAVPAGKAEVQDQDQGLGHEVPVSLFYKVFGALIVLTVITIAASHVDFGSPSYNLIIAMAIASIKAGLVGAFFMHLAYESKLLWVFVAFPLVLLAIMIGLIFLDNPYRDHPKPVKVVTETAK
jgi:cytochrome c oxidase subunit 4